MIEQIQTRAEKAIAEKVYPGCVIGIVHADGSREILPYGNQTYQANSPVIQENTIYDLASITKSIPVASLAAILVREEKLSLTEKVTTYIPELQNDFGATIEDLLRYHVRGPRMSTLPFTTFEQIRTHILETGFQGPPDEHVYANAPAFILGMVLERVSGEILPALAHTYLFEPLDMRDTTFFPHDIDRCAPTEIADGKEIRGIVHDESARIFAKARRAVGHAGLFSTAPDLLNFIEALLNNKLPDVVDFAKRGLGWQVNESWMGNARNEKTFGKTGFTGTSILIDREKGIGLVILSNRTYPKRPMDSSTINSFRSDVADSLY